MALTIQALQIELRAETSKIRAEIKKAAEGHTITGDLTLNGVTQSVVLDTKLNKADTHPMAQKPWIGFDATTTLIRSDFNVGAFAPFVSDEVEVTISGEPYLVKAGEVLLLPANEPHALKAVTRFKMLLTMIRS